MFSIGLCRTCQFAKELKHPRGEQSYWQCENIKIQVKYPRLPVLTCQGYKA